MSSAYFNEAGEPLMDGAAMRYEMYLDSIYEPDPDDFYESWERSYDEPEFDDEDSFDVAEDAWLDGSYEE